MKGQDRLYIATLVWSVMIKADYFCLRVLPSPRKSASRSLAYSYR